MMSHSLEAAVADGTISEYAAKLGDDMTDEELISALRKEIEYLKEENKGLRAAEQELLPENDALRFQNNILRAKISEFIAGEENCTFDVAGKIALADLRQRREQHEPSALHEALDPPRHLPGKRESPSTVSFPPHTRCPCGGAIGWNHSFN